VPFRLPLAGDGPVQESDDMAAMFQFCCRGEDVGFRAREGPGLFMNEEQFHFSRRNVPLVIVPRAMNVKNK